MNGTIAMVPANLTATAGDQQVSLHWTPSPQAKSYSIYRRPASAPESDRRLIRSGETANSFTDTGLVNGSSYCYVVRAINARDEESDPSNEVSATPQTPGVAGSTIIPAAMFRLNRLQVRGFRGFLDSDAGDFALDSPVTILFGPNGCGKSSTLNAVEWDLFGDECSGKKTNIRERVDWVVANQHANPGQVEVELELGDSDGSYIVRRTLRTRARRKTPEESVEVELPGGECLTGSKAELFLGRLHRSTFRDFATTVYQHQEVIRAIVTVEPRERSDAIDRLLGLSDYRNLVDALNKVNAKGWQRDLFGECVAFEESVKSALQIHQRELEERRGEAGVSRDKLNVKSALDISCTVRQSLDQFTTDAGLELMPLQVPQNRLEIKPFCDAVGAAINRLRGEIPAAKEQGELVKRRGEVTQLQSDLKSAKEKQGQIGNAIRGLDQEHGGQNSASERLAKVRTEIKQEKASLREANARAALINEAISFLEAEETKGRLAGLCPVCGNEAPDLLAVLCRRWEDELQAQVKKSKGTIESLQTEETRLQGAEDSYKTWNDKLTPVAKELERCRQQAGELLGRDMKAEDDPPALLNHEAGKIETRLEALKNAIEEKQRRLSDIARELEMVRIIDDILHLEEKKHIIEQIQRSSEYGELEARRDRAAELVDDLEAIRAAISEVANEEARDKVAAAQSAIDRYFRRLTNHPAVSAIKLAVSTDKRTQRNDYTISDQDGNDLTPILSQGDLNALALAFFLGLTASAKDSGAFGFVLMDDPSQSLDSDHKKQLVQVFNEVACQKQLVLSTMDREFRDYLTEGLTKVKKEYVFQVWTPEKGPTITPR